MSQIQRSLVTKALKGRQNLGNRPGGVNRFHQLNNFKAKGFWEPNDKKFEITGGTKLKH
jgi:hypothetical protein